MTNQEYLNAILGNFEVTDEQILIMLIEQDIDPNGPISGKADMEPLKKAMYYQLPLMLAGIQNVSEGGYSIKWNLDGIKMWYSALAKELGLEDVFNPPPTVTGITPW